MPDVFHDTAYKRGDSPMIIDCARRGIFIGFPLLHGMGDGVRRAECTLTQREAFPSQGEMDPRVTRAERPKGVWVGLKNAVQ